MTIAIVQRLLREGAPSGTIGVIAFYSAQVLLIRSLLDQAALQEVEVLSVDASQGREKEFIILSFTRVGDKCTFISNPNRLNVAHTRAKAGLILVGHAPTLLSSALLTRLLRHLAARNSLFDGSRGILSFPSPPTYNLPSAEVNTLSSPIPSVVPTASTAHIYLLALSARQGWPHVLASPSLDLPSCQMPPFSDPRPVAQHLASTLGAILMQHPYIQRDLSFYFGAECLIATQGFDWVPSSVTFRSTHAHLNFNEYYRTLADSPAFQPNVAAAAAAPSDMDVEQGAAGAAPLDFVRVGGRGKKKWGAKDYGNSHSFSAPAPPPDPPPSPSRPQVLTASLLLLLSRPA